MAGCHVPFADSIQVEVAQRFASIGSILGALDRFLKLALQQIGLVTLSVHRLTKKRFLASFLLPHCARSLFEIIEGFGTRGRSVRDHGPGFGIDLQQSSAAGTADLEGIHFRFSHWVRLMRMIAQFALWGTSRVPQSRIAPARAG